MNLGRFCFSTHNRRIQMQPDTSLSTFPPMKIAFLEDDAAFAANIIEWIEQVGHTVTWFRTGRECVRALTDERFDLCLFDWMLPDMTGPDVMASLKLKGTLPPVIFLTGRDAEEDVAEKHGGSIAVESELERFTCFRLHLPLAQSAQQ
ncbi:MAG: response regulator [Gammaproteobacteria bacterium]